MDYWPDQENNRCSGQSEKKQDRGKVISLKSEANLQ